MSARPSGTVTFLFTDVVGSTRLWEQSPAAAAAAVARHAVLVRQGLAGHGAYVFKSLGDGFCVAFSHASNAVEAAVDAQRLLVAEDWSALGDDFPGLAVRMAIHTGAAEERDGDYFGPTLNRVARLMAAGHGGQVLLTQTTEQLLNDPSPVGVTLRSLGERRLKDLHRSETVFQVVADGIPADFPPLDTLEAHRHNLPVQLTSFVGRERELTAITLMVAQRRLVTVTGPGGCGKTRLALQVAADIVDRFADGVWLVDLEPIQEADLLAQTAATVLGVQEEPGRPLLTTITDYLARRSVLLILDDNEHLPDGSARFADALLGRCPNLHILATSRSALGLGGESVWSLDTLAVPERLAEGRLEPDALAEVAKNEAVSLFVDRAMAAQAGFRLTESNAGALVDICRRLEGMPLAVELCAARVKVLSLDQIAARLDDRLRLLVGGSRTAAARQQTLRATINWSHDLLSEDERVLFRRMAVFRGGCTLETAEAVLADERLDSLAVLDLVGNLVDKSLVRVEERAATNRYRMLDTLREYARERAAAAGESETLRWRLVRWASKLAQAAAPELRGPAQAEWLERLEDEHDNLRAALEWAMAYPQHRDDTGVAPADEVVTEALTLGANLWPFWQQRGYFTEGRERLAALEALSADRPADGANDAGGAGLVASNLNGAGVLATRQSDYAAAEALFRWGLDLLRRPAGIPHAYQPIEAELLTNLGTLYYEQSNFDAARHSYEEALAAWRSLHDRWGIARTLNNLGLVAMNAGEADAARAYYREAQALLKALGDRLRLSIALSNLGILALHGGELGEARRLFAEALGVQRALGDRARIASSENLLGLVAYYERDLPRAGQHFAESLAIRRALGDRSGEAKVLRDRARLELASSEPAIAAATIRACLALHEQLGKNLSLAGALEVAAYVANHQGKTAHAAHMLAAAETLRGEAGLAVDADALAEHNAVVGSVRASLGDKAADEAWAVGRQLGWQAALAEALRQAEPVAASSPLG